MLKGMAKLFEFRKQKNKGPEILNLKTDIEENIIRIKTKSGKTFIFTPISSERDNDIYFELQNICKELESVEHLDQVIFRYSPRPLLMINEESEFLISGFKYRHDSNTESIDDTIENINSRYKLGQNNNDTDSEQLFLLAFLETMRRMIDRLNKNSRKSQLLRKVNSYIELVKVGRYALKASFSNKFYLIFEFPSNKN